MSGTIVRVDFYQLSTSSAEAALPLIARAAMKAGERMLVVSADEAQLAQIGDALWTRQPDSFLAHGMAGDPDASRQPILLSTVPEPVNGARFLALADGQWREGSEPFERTFLLFGEAGLQAARECWRMLGSRAKDGEGGVERRFWKQDGGKWVEGP
jgi:DNA polymerase-3 subunit chi